jgi:hypothetical protein
MSEATKTGRLRSPPYPTLPLQRAIERADQLYRQERDHAVPLSSAARAWNVSSTSSSPITIAGALRQYGLIEYDGEGNSKKLRLTHEALRILLDRIPTSPERLEALRRAFLKPKVFLELWEKWKADLPSDQTMQNYLVLERRLADQAPYSEQAAAELLANYRASRAFAAPTETDIVPSTSDEPQATEGFSMDTVTAERAQSASAQPRHAGQPQAQPATAYSVGSGERVVFVEEGAPGQHVKLLASGELDHTLLEALEDYVKRLKKRLANSGAVTTN